MTTQEWIEYTEREIGRMQWLEAARDFGKTLLARQKEVEHATRDRDAALAARDAALAEIKAKQEQYARDGAAALAELGAQMKTRQDKASAELAKAHAELAAVQAKIDRARHLAGEAEDERIRASRRAEQEGAAISTRLNALRADERAIRERLAAALKG